MKKDTRKILLFAGIVALLLIIGYSFVPQVLGGQVINQSDITGYRGMAQEAASWNASHPDDKTAWTNSMFGGMPTTMITGNPDGDWTQKIYEIFMAGKRPGSYLFISLLGAFLLMLSLGINWILAIGGAIAITFCSYNPQILQVGHNTKMQALAWLPWVLAAVIFTYKSALGEYREASEGNRKWIPATILGAALFGFALNFQIKANHVQITYYLAIIIFCYAIVELIKVLLNKANKHLFGRFVISSALLLVLGIAGIATNTDKLLPTYLYSQETMRGGSDLVRTGDGEKSSTGLDINYATAWSYGWNELPNLLIPNFNGGSSAGELSMDSETVTLLRNSGQPNINQIAKALPLYWGPQPFTAGPMYMGAITIFLFILGLMLYKGSDKWWLTIATIIAICLGVGYHFMPFTEFWFYHVPFYNKFRTVSMALVILQFTLPMLGFLVLDRIFKGNYNYAEVKKKSLIALSIAGGFCLICALMPSIAGSFSAPSDSGMAPILSEALRADRKALLRSDALVSLLMIVLAFVLVMWGISTSVNDEKCDSLLGYDSKKKTISAACIGILVLINLFSTGKRYLNGDHFTPEVQFDNHFTARQVDKEILKDTSLSYRVLDLTANCFNDSYASYFHKNIGGYSPVKLQRYQDLIDRHLTEEINSVIESLNNSSSYQEISANMPHTPALSMLNWKYLIIGADAAPVINESAMGNCWLVSNAVEARTPEDEIGLIGQTDLWNAAIIGEDFSEFRADVKPGSDSDAISLVSYAPNELKYRYNTASERTAVFSEIYYPRGWKATLEDGTEVKIFRADWILRGATLPAGNHELTMRFEPESYKIGSAVSRAASAILIILVIGAACLMIVEHKKDQESRL